MPLRLCFVSDRRDRGEGARTGDESDGDLHHGVRRNGAHRAAANARQQQHLQQGQKNENIRSFLQIHLLPGIQGFDHIRQLWVRPIEY